VPDCASPARKWSKKQASFVVLLDGNAVERKGGVIAFEDGNRQREGTDLQWKAAALVRWHEPMNARVFKSDL